jgi:hypothetical protein
MANANLEALMERLKAIPAVDLDQPDMPMSVALQEASDLAVLVNTELVRNRLVAVGCQGETLALLPKVVDATRAAQSEWAVSRDRSKGEAQRNRETAGDALRADLIAACRFNLRHNRTAQATLDAIVQGEGVADLVQDLKDLGALIERHTEAFAADQTFDPSRAAESARSLAADIEAGLSGTRATRDQDQAKLVRDQAYTLLDDLMAEVRNAGKYAFRKEPAMAAKFTSQYLRRKRRRRASAQAETKPVQAGTSDA